MPVHIYTKCTYFFKELVKSLILVRTFLWSQMVGTQLISAHTMAMLWCTVFTGSEGAIAFGLAGSRSPKDTIRSLSLASVF